MADPPSLLAITDSERAAALFAGLGAGPTERAAVLYLDPEWRLLGRSDFTGERTRIAPSLRAVIAEALRLDAAALVLAHGHPSGRTAPSAADLDYTRTLVRVAEALDLVVADHLIFAGDAVTSLRDKGLL